MFPIMPLKYCPYVNVQQKKMLSLELSASAAHTWKNNRLNISEFPFIRNRIRSWHFKSHGIDKNCKLCEYQREFYWPVGWEKIRIFCFGVDVCMCAFQSTTMSIQAARTSGFTWSKAQRGFSIISIKDNIDEHDAFLHKFGYIKPVFLQWGKKNFSSER